MQSNFVDDVEVNEIVPAPPGRAVSFKHWDISTF